VTAVRFHVSGRVQGVSFRYYTQQQARALGLAGYARNLSDGRVEVLAIGDDAALEQLALWLAHGPAPARVAEVVRSPADANEWRERGFETG
jgi:acylphosphatase